MLRYVADKIESPCYHLRREGIQSKQDPDVSPTLISPEYQYFQELPYRVLSRYLSVSGKDALEIGGAQACLSARPFLMDGASSVTVTGLDHITEESVISDQRLRIVKADGLDLRSHFEASSFDCVYGLSLMEHIPSPDIFLEEVYRVLRPGGLAFFEGNPLWSSSLGHHLWVASWGGKYQGKTTKNYLFNTMSGVASLNPIPDWGHLLMDQEELRLHLQEKTLPPGDVDCIVDWTYHNKDLNRLSSAELVKAYANSRLKVLEINANRVEVPAPVLIMLRERYGDGCDFGITGLTILLAKPRRDF